MTNPARSHGLLAAGVVLWIGDDIPEGWEECTPEESDRIRAWLTGDRAPTSNREHWIRRTA